MPPRASRESNPMLVVCRVCASEYAIGATRHASACTSCDDDHPPAHHGRQAPRRDHPSWFPRGAASSGRSRERSASFRQGRAISHRLAAICRAPAFLIALAALGATSAVAARTSIVGAIPETAILYAAAGLPVHLGGFSLREASSVVEAKDGGAVLVVQGRIENVGRSRAAPPPIAVTLRGANGERLYGWNVQPPGEALASGESAAFRGRLAAPPGGIADVELVLAPAKPERVASGGP